MAVAGFAPRALRLDDLYYDGDPATREPWDFPSGLFDELDCLELSHYTGMFDFATAALQRPPEPTPIPNVARLRPVSILKLRYSEKHLREGGSTFLLHTIPALGDSLRSLCLNDSSPLYSGAYRMGRYGVESPLESLTKLRTLVLAGDVSPFLVSGRLEHIIEAIKDTIINIEIRVPTAEITNDGLSLFLQCEHLESLILRVWEPPGTEDPLTPVVVAAPTLPSLAPSTPLDLEGADTESTKLTLTGVRNFFSATRRVLVPQSIPEDRLVLQELKLSKDFCEMDPAQPKKVLDKQGWKNLRRWVKEHGGRFSLLD